MNDHKIDGSCWCLPVVEALPDGRQVEKHNTTFLDVRAQLEKVL